MVLIPYSLQTVEAWEVTGGIGALYLILVRNYDLTLISNCAFILAISGRSSSKQFPQGCPYIFENVMFI